MSTSPLRSGMRALASVAAIVSSFVACGGGHHLAEYTFASLTLAVVYIAPPAPELLTGYYERVPTWRGNGKVAAPMRDSIAQRHA